MPSTYTVEREPSLGDDEVGDPGSLTVVVAVKTVLADVTRDHVVHQADRHLVVLMREAGAAVRVDAVEGAVGVDDLEGGAELEIDAPGELVRAGPGPRGDRDGELVGDHQLRADRAGAGR